MEPKHESTESTHRGIPLHTKILLALIGGAVLGVLANLYAPKEPIEQLLHYVMEPIGQVFLRLLFLTVIPLVFASLAVGVARLGEHGSLGRIGFKTFGYFVITMALAVTIGLVLVNTIQPGGSIPDETKKSLLDRYGKDAAKKTDKVEFGVETFVSIVPRNPLKAMVDFDMLAVIFTALLVGIAITRIDKERGALLIKLLDGINDVMVTIIGWAMAFAPFGVFALIFTMTSRFGFDLLLPLMLYVVTVLVGLAIQMFGSLSILIAVFSRLSPIVFFRKVRNVMITAFSTSSSNATLPTSIKTAEEELGVPAPIAGFVLPLGATMNMNGTALFEGVTVVFLAQVFGVPLSIQQQLIVIVLAVLTAIGAAGVPGGSLPLLALVLQTVQVPVEGIALILGVDRILDMCRTTLNVIGDLAAATFVARSEGYELKTE